MNIRKAPALLLAVALQVLPLYRVACVNAAAAPTGFAIVMRWLAGAVALLGSYHAVSGASAAISGVAPYSAVGGTQTGPVTSSAVGTVGKPFVYRIVVTNPGTDHLQDFWNTFPLPPGLTINTNIGGNGYITGTPTAGGVTSVTLLAGNQNCSCFVTKAATITISGGSGGSPPQITAQPQSLTVTNGSAASFSVTASGTAPLSYQWRKGGSGLLGATTSTYSIASVATNDAGNYTVVITNSAGSITSAVASLTVALPPAIITPPQDQTVQAGAKVSLTVTAAGSSPLAYSWTFKGWAIAGATTSTLNLSGVQPADSGTYSVIVSNSAGSVSASAVLTVNLAATPPSITSQPQSLTVSNGAAASFSVTASGTPPLSYEWLKGGSSISGATTSSYSIASVTTNDAGSFSVIITNSAGSITSAVASLTVLLPPSILAPPQSMTVSNGNTAKFSVVASGSAPLTFQWKLNGSDIAGGTTSSLSISSAQTTDQGDYTVVVSNAVAAVTSPAAHLTVQTGLSSPFQLTNWQLSNGSVSFDITAPAQTNVVLWSSIDLTHWTAVSTNFTGSGTMHFSDTNVPDAVEFYRATLKP